MVGLNNMFSLSTIYFKIVSLHLFSLEKCEVLISLKLINLTCSQVSIFCALVVIYSTMERQESMRFMFLPLVKDYKLNVLKEKRNCHNT